MQNALRSRTSRVTLCLALLGRECQTSDWKSHKRACAAAPKWYDRHRKCQDGSKHEGRLELVTWDCPEEELGWDACFANESENLKKEFETEYGGDEKKFSVGLGQRNWTTCGRGPSRSKLEVGC
ncbi:hypothetical protein R3P38DRAFT_192679 [Favolaschia claudopus]|uniref:Uncharacterized protein n=1 Tax=Favolaschia claudopus TaxID=2862362 RepID=A0AAV9ZU73_9AGAR